jgi:hypothetical protein
MRTMQRAVAVVGLTLMTGGVLGVTASAASAAPSEEKVASQSVERRGDDGNGRDRGRDGDRDGDRDRDRRDRWVTAGVYRSLDKCRSVGWWGDVTDRWENPRCYQIGRRAWVLKVQPDHDRRGGGRHG